MDGETDHANGKIGHVKFKISEVPTRTVTLVPEALTSKRSQVAATNLYKKPNHSQNNSLWDKVAASSEKMRKYYDRGVIVPLRASSAPKSLNKKDDRKVAKCVSVPDMVNLLGLGRGGEQSSIEDHTKPNWTMHGTQTRNKKR